MRTHILWRLVETSRRKVDGLTISIRFQTFSGFWIYLKSYLRVFSRELKMWKEGINDEMRATSIVSSGQNKVRRK
jgi:hypothetical protein